MHLEVMMDTEIMPGPDGLLSRKQAAALCGVTPEAINNWVRDGYGPKGQQDPAAREAARHHRASAL